MGRYKLFLESLINSPEFQRWFAGSKVVDEDGNPLKLYHGTIEAFNKFDSAKSREGDDAIFFTPNTKSTSNFAIHKSIWTGANVKPVYVKADKILTIDGHYDSIRKIEDSAKFDDMKYGETVREYTKRIGYDGICFKNVVDDIDPDTPPTADVYAFFNSAKIKSAIGNKGTFNPESDDINEGCEQNG